MRRSTVFSFFVAAVLAVLAVVAVQSWLTTERRNILEQAMQSGDKPDAATQVVVASKPLRFGERVTAAKLKLIDWPSDSTPSGSFTDVATVVGVDEETARYVLSAMEIDEPVLNSKITIPGQKAKLSTALSPGMKAISIPVSAVLGVAGFVLPGDRVDVMLIRGNRVDVLLQGLRVLAIDQNADERADQPKVVRTVTFEVSTQEAQRLILASKIGTLSLALRNIGSADTVTPEPMTVTELLGPEASQSLVQEVAAAAQDDGRLEGLENELKSVDQRIDEVADSLRSEVEQALLQRQAQEAAAEQAPVVQDEPKFITVGVTRNGRTADYRFRAN